METQFSHVMGKGSLTLVYVIGRCRTVVAGRANAPTGGAQSGRAGRSTLAQWMLPSESRICGAASVEAAPNADSSSACTLGSS